jgi:Flp pilus assembly pilin Flp
MASPECHWVGPLDCVSLDVSDSEPVSFWSAAIREMGANLINTIQKLWIDEKGQDVAEYAVMLAVILVIVIGTVRLIGGSANNVFSQVSSGMTQ